MGDSTTPATNHHVSVRRRWGHRRVGRQGDGGGVPAQPPGERGPRGAGLWERSLDRSLRRRESAAARRTGAYKGKRALVSAALLTATVVAPANEAARAQEHPVAGTATTGMLRKGSRGPAVAAAQRALGVPPDGIFGPQTRRAVRAFQRAHGLEIDGVIGPITAGALASGGGTGAGGPAPPPAT